MNNMMTKFKAMEQVYAETVDPDKYTVLRIDGKGFSRLTAPLRKDGPFNAEFTQAMIATMRDLMVQVDGAVLGYTQSDEITIVIKPVNPEKTGATLWFGGKVQKMVSLAASYTGLLFQKYMTTPLAGLPAFDARIMSMDKHDVVECITWRRMDALNNSVSMLAGYNFSHKSLMGISREEKIARLAEKGISWEEDTPEQNKGGTVAYRVKEEGEVTYFHRGEQEWKTATAMRNVVITKPLTDTVRDKLLDLI